MGDKSKIQWTDATWNPVLKCITRTCHICGRKRPDGKISLHQRDMSHRFKHPLGTIQENIRHCNDDPNCAEKAKSFSFFKKALDL